MEISRIPQIVCCIPPEIRSEGTCGAAGAQTFFSYGRAELPAVPFGSIWESPKISTFLNFDVLQVHATISGFSLPSGRSTVNFQLRGGRASGPISKKIHAPCFMFGAKHGEHEKHTLVYLRRENPRDPADRCVSWTRKSGLRAPFGHIYCIFMAPAPDFAKFAVFSGFPGPECCFPGPIQDCCSPRI